MQPNKRTRASIAYLPGAEAFQFVDTLLSWLERSTLTIEDAESTILHGCELADGMTADGLTRFFIESHQLPQEDAIHVGQLAALLLYRGRLKRLPGGRYASHRGKAEPNVIALLRIPIGEWEALSLNQYVHRGRAAYVAGEADRA